MRSPTSKPGGCYQRRRPVPAATAKYGEMLKAITGLFFFSNYFQPYE
jgi:hypothetical protein